MAPHRGWGRGRCLEHGSGRGDPRMRTSATRRPDGPTLRLYGWTPRRSPWDARRAFTARTIRAVAMREGLESRPPADRRRLRVLHELERTYAVVGALGTPPSPAGAGDLPRDRRALTRALATARRGRRRRRPTHGVAPARRDRWRCFRARRRAGRSSRTAASSSGRLRSGTPRRVPPARRRSRSRSDPARLSAVLRAREVDGSSFIDLRFRRGERRRRRRARCGPCVARVRGGVR